MRFLLLVSAILSQGVSWASSNVALDPQAGVYKFKSHDLVADVTIKDVDGQDIFFDVTIEANGRMSSCSFKSEAAQRPEMDREQGFFKEIRAIEGQCEVVITSNKIGQISVTQEPGSLCTAQCGAGASLDIPKLILQK